MSLPEAVLAGAFLKSGGRAIVVGDHRQMPPILAHPWKAERRRGAVALQPARSLFETLVSLGHATVKLDQSFRLHETQAELLARHVYAQDGVRFHSRRRELLAPVAIADPFVAAALHPEYPIVVIEHREAASQQLNTTEIDLIAPIAEACLHTLGLNAKTGIGIVVPHNAQKAALCRRLPELAAAGAIDTVERFQGDERGVIIVSATASDPGAILAEAEFLLNLNRLNVALSRAQTKLIVVGARAFFRFVCSDLDLFEQGLLWKYLRYDWTRTPLWHGAYAGVAVEILGHHCGHPIPPPPRIAAPLASLDAPEEDGGWIAEDAGF